MTSPSPPSPPKSTTSTSSSTSKNKMPPSAPPPTANQLPTPSTLHAASTTPLYDASNQTHPFSSVYTTPHTATMTLLVFIRHFFCGNCQEYLRRLASLIPPSSLPPSTSIVIIGCGSPSLIPSYIEALACVPPFPYPIYAEPTKTLHAQLAMQYSLSLGSKSPSYMERSLLRVNLESTFQGLKRVWAGHGDALSAGDMRLNGGDFLVETDAEGKARVRWCHRMGNTRDHVEIEALKKVLRLGDTDTDATGAGVRPGVGRRRSTAERLRRSFSNRRQSWLGRNGSAGREKDGNISSRDASRRRSPERGMNVVREEMRSRDEEEKPAFAAMNGGMERVGVVST